MWTVRLRDRRIWIALTLLAAGLCAWGLFDVHTEVRVRPETLFTLPWGTGEGAVGRAEAAGRVFGPRSFAVVDDRIYIADTFNGRVLVVDMGGRVIATYDLSGLAAAEVDADVARILPGAVLVTAPAGGDRPARAAPWVNDIAIGPDGRIYLADATAPRILVLEADGTPAATLDVSGAGPTSDPGGDAIWLTERLWVDEAGLLYLTHAYLSDAILSRRVTRFERDGGTFAHLSSISLREGSGLRVDEESLLPVVANSFAVGADGRLYVESAGGSPFIRVVRAYDREARLEHSWQVTRPQMITRAALIGVDARRWVYLGLGIGDAQGEVVLLAPELGTLYEAKVGWQAGFEANVYARLAADELYLARPASQGWELQRWQIDRVRRILPVGRR
ncbi:MAG TPA: hypothetical protein VIL95_05070 [Bacillota bacterium]